MAGTSPHNIHCLRPTKEPWVSSRVFISFHPVWPECLIMVTKSGGETKGEARTGQLNTVLPVLCPSELHAAKVTNEAPN